MNKTAQNILLIGGIGVVVYLILTQKKATPQPTVIVTNPQPISSGSYQQGLINTVLPNVLTAIDNTWFT